jgi:hypothetical protein
MALDPVFVESPIPDIEIPAFKRFHSIETPMLRDRFALAAMQASLTRRVHGAYNSEVIAHNAYRMADAMLAARGDEPQKGERL